MTLPQDVAALAELIVNTLTHTDYQHVDKIDPASGVYVCDCNGFVAYVLNSAAPKIWQRSRSTPRRDPRS